MHRDIKPANLFLARLPTGQFSLKILDFGIAKQRMDQNPPALTTRQEPGSALVHVARADVDAGKVDERADVWSWACLLLSC